MKKLITILFVGIFFWPVSVQAFSAAINAASGVSAAAASECTGYVVCQNWEGVGEDNSESWTVVSGGINEDYTTAPSPLRGSQSVSVIYSGAIAYYDSPAFTNADEVWGHTLFNTSDNLTDFGSDIIRVYNSVGTKVMGVSIGTDNKLIISNGTLNSSAGATVLSQSTTYRIWFYYKKGTGSNGISTLWLDLASNGTSRPGSSEATKTNGNATTQADHAGLVNGNNELFVADQYYIKLSEFTTVLE